jgi:hypothetical protein
MNEVAVISAIAVAVLIDPFRLIPLLLIAYFVPSRWAAGAYGAVVSILVWTINFSLHVLPFSELDAISLFLSVVLGFLVCIALHGPMRRWHARRTTKETAAN